MERAQLSHGGDRLLDYRHNVHLSGTDIYMGTRNSSEGSEDDSTVPHHYTDSDDNEVDFNVQERQGYFQHPSRISEGRLGDRMTHGQCVLIIYGSEGHPRHRREPSPDYGAPRLGGEQSSGRSRSQHSGPSIMSQATKFSIHGGRLSAVRGNQTIRGISSRWESGPSHRLHRRKFKENSPGSTERVEISRQHQSTMDGNLTARGLPHAFTEAHNFSICGGEVSIVNRDQTISELCQRQ
ncbi:hypothetical protein C8R42DRAFT_409167 [Lentinula raphanica]|nr:hypothetical protein C8R42DRAFT_409167 [Lentinula raphanica]